MHEPHLSRHPPHPARQRPPPRSSRHLGLAARSRARHPNESHIYSILNSRDPGLAPQLLAHINDNAGARIIGFLLERIPAAREAGGPPTDLEKCKAALARLHALGIAHGDGPLERHSFLICPSADGDGDDRVLLQGFGGAFLTPDEAVLGRERANLEQMLAPSACREASALEKQNAPVDRARSNQHMAFLSHGLMHPFMHWQEVNNAGGRVTLTVEEHREMVAELKANGYRWTEEDLERAKVRFGAGQAVGGAGAGAEKSTASC